MSKLAMPLRSASATVTFETSAMLAGTSVRGKTTTGWPRMMRLVDGVLLADALADVVSVAPMVMTVPVGEEDSEGRSVAGADALGPALSESDAEGASVVVRESVDRDDRVPGHPDSVLVPLAAALPEPLHVAAADRVAQAEGSAEALDGKVDSALFVSPAEEDAEALSRPLRLPRMLPVALRVSPENVLEAEADRVSRALAESLTMERPDDVNNGDCVALAETRGLALLLADDDIADVGDSDDVSLGSGDEVATEVLLLLRAGLGEELRDADETAEAVIEMVPAAVARDVLVRDDSVEPLALDEYTLLLVPQPLELHEMTELVEVCADGDASFESVPEIEKRAESDTAADALPMTLRLVLAVDDRLDTADVLTPALMLALAVSLGDLKKDGDVLPLPDALLTPLILALPELLDDIDGLLECWAVALAAEEDLALLDALPLGVTLREKRADCEADADTTADFV